MKKVLLIAIAIFYNLSANTQVPPLITRAITTEDGLPQGFVTSIVQDRKGFMWFGTLDGLARYDGKQFNVYRHEETNNQSLTANVVQHLSFDTSDKLWVQYENGNSDILTTNTEEITRLPYSLPDSSRFWSFTRYKFDKSGASYRIYFSPRPAHSIMIRVNPVSLKQEIIKYPKGAKLGDFAVDSAGQVWVLCYRSLLVLKKKNELLHVDSLPKELLAEQKLDSVQNRRFLHYDSSSNVLVIGTPRAFWYFYIRDKKWQRVAFNSFANNKIPTKIISDGTGNFYTVIAEKIFYVNRRGEMQMLWENQLKYPQIIDLFIDREKLMWVGTNTFGVRLLRFSNSGFRSGPVNNFFFYDLLPQFYPFVKNEFTKYVFGNLEMSGRSILDRDNNLWFLNNQYSQINGKNLQANNISKAGVNGVIAVNLQEQRRTWRINNIAFDNRNRCWVITDRDRHLLRINTETGYTDTSILLSDYFSFPNYLLAVDSLLCIVIDKSLLFYNTTTGQQKLYRDQPSVTVFKNASLLMATRDHFKKEILWLSTRGGGLIRFNISTGECRAFTQFDGLPNNTVYAALADKKGYLWCSSNNGIFRFNPRDSSVISFTEKDGLQGNEFNRYQFIQLPDGRMVFGGTQGYTVFHPDSIHVDEYQPNVELTDIAIRNESIFKTPQWHEQFPSTDTLWLAYNQNFLTFRFAALQYNNSGRIQYRYRLVGIDKTWIVTGDQNTANFTNLSPGKYELQINATNSAGTWSSKIKTVQFTISPPWWRTWWAYFAYLVLAGSIVTSVYRLQLNQAKAKQEIALKQKEADQLKAIDAIKTRFFSNITHEFRTPLSLIISPAEQLQLDANTPVFVRSGLQVIHRNARQLLRLINQLLDMSKIESGTMTVSLSRGLISAFIDDCLQAFRDLATAKKINLHLIDNSIATEVLFDADKMEKVVYNLLSNAVKFTPEGGSITVTIVQENTTGLLATKLQVQDTGVGIEPNVLPKIFERFYQADDTATRKHEGTGIGLALVKELVEIMQGKIEAESIKGAGTTFSLWLNLPVATTQNVPVWARSKNSYHEPSAIDTNKSIAKTENDPLVLVVEDNEELRSFISEMLRTNYRVITAVNGKEALEITLRELPDLVLSDIMMPEMDGYAFCEAVKSETTTEHISVVLLTAKAAHESVMEGLQSGADDYITKPFHYDELQLRIRNILERREKLRKFYQAQLNNPDVALSITSADHPFISSLYGIIEANLDDSGFSVEKLAAASAMSSRTLNRKLASLAGLSANEIIRQYRLRRAADLLKDGANVSEAAYKVGFETHAHFTTSFKSLFGITPSDFLLGQQKH